jgi:U3 small nucleolar RNA-associated protein 10
LEVVVKLNETAFRPLFRRLYDWAFVAENGEFELLIGSVLPWLITVTANIERKITFLHMYSALLDYFKVHF